MEYKFNVITWDGEESKGVVFNITEYVDRIRERSGCPDSELTSGQVADIILQLIRDNDEAADKGFILIEGGQLDLTAGLDGVQAESQLVVRAGELQITSGGGAPDSVATFDQGRPGEFNTTDTTESTKGLKAGVDLTITGGLIQVDALDDALH